MAQVCFGAGFQNPRREQLGRDLLEVLKTHGVKWIDTSRIYENGGSEKFLGIVGAPKDFAITTKAITNVKGAGRKEVMLKSAVEQFEALKTDKVPFSRLLMPFSYELKLKFSETGRGLPPTQPGRLNTNRRNFGLSNFTPRQVQEAYDTAASKGYILPTVYQVNYNIVARRAEAVLFPLLKKLGFTQIQSYSPLAGGFLTKSPREVASPEANGRWDESNLVGKLYQGMYNKPSLIEALRKFEEISFASGISKSSLANRWVRYHSMASRESDIIIIGARTVEQLEGALFELDEGPLNEDLVKEIDALWDDIQADAPTDNYQGLRKHVKAKL
ncbi:MAG: hypothetical protein LQ342_006348 [Letrouitia transgressa]|nr:MAG: hypothetical protein LQ342_006348 [Letrouitia transgressa]